MRLVLVTDSHLAADAAPCNRNWAAAKAFARGAGADLTIHLGDITLDGACDPAQHAFALAAVADWPTPLRYLPGNHDIGDNPPSPGVPATEPLDLALLDQYRRQFGADHWRFAADGWLVLGLDAQLLGSGVPAEAEQWAWLEGELAAAAGRPVALLLHKPLFLRDPGEASPPLIRYVPLEPRRRLLALLARVELRLVLSGHAHQYLDRVIDGVRHIWLPSTAFIIPDDRQDRVGEKVTGVGLLELSPEGHHRFDLICPDGMVRHDVTTLGLKIK
ncbi:MAG TPA: metallophosphoesterase [Stellaceae bacterium]|nr:metallophosphoesterase [Stellaceae bacterium]